MCVHLYIINIHSSHKYYVNTNTNFGFNQSFDITRFDWLWPVTAYITCCKNDCWNMKVENKKMSLYIKISGLIHSSVKSMFNLLFDITTDFWVKKLVPLMFAVQKIPRCISAAVCWTCPCVFRVGSRSH